MARRASPFALKLLLGAPVRRWFETKNVVAAGLTDVRFEDAHEGHRVTGLGAKPKVRFQVSVRYPTAASFSDQIDGLRGNADGGFAEMPDMKAPPSPISAANDPISQAGDQHYYDFHGSNLTRADAEHIAARVAVRVAEANNQDQRRTQFDRQKMDQRAFG